MALPTPQPGINWRDHLHVDPAILAGKPVVRGTRLSVDFIVGLFAQGWSHDDVLRNYPGLTRESILACLLYAKERLDAERIFPLSA